MKATWYLMIGLLLIPHFGVAQTKLSPAQQARLDSLEQQVLERVGRTQGAGAGVGANGNWEQEKQLLTQTFSCIQKTDAQQTGALLGCLDPLRLLYEQERANQLSSVNRLARTLAQMPFITKDRQSIYLITWLGKQLNSDTLPQQVQDYMPQTQDADLFIKQMQQWHKHLLTDTPSKIKSPYL